MSTSQQSKRTLLGDKFLIGEELGRGAYGQVFKGMDTSTGDVVAIKQIGLGGVSQANLQGVMGEIDLLKTLNHNNIVKYIGSFKTRNHLYIILEFMENGALSSVIKPNRFGVFPETLVAIYIAQVLQGLVYLHDQGVVHRDIKGANILTTKDVSTSHKQKPAGQQLQQPRGGLPCPQRLGAGRGLQQLLLLMLLHSHVAQTTNRQACGRHSLPD